MKYTCDLIQDLLPLYLDGVCSEESKEAIEGHLPDCSDCKEFYAVMCEADRIEIDAHSEERERQKVASFQTVKKKLFRKWILTGFFTVVGLVAIVFAVVGILKNTVEVVEYEDNISVSMVDGDLIGRLKGSQETHVRIKRVVCMVDGQEEEYLFFCISETKWNDLTINSKMFSEYTLCFADKGANEIDAVFYFTGDYTDIETMSSEELQEVIDASKLLWNNPQSS